MLDEQEYQTMLDNRNQKRKKREAREATDQSEPLYCFCQQVSYGEMVACDGEVSELECHSASLIKYFRIARMNGFIWTVLV
jgi:hypothetical protein